MEETNIRAARALLTAKCGTGDKCRFPKVYIVDGSPFFTLNAALRHQQWKNIENKTLVRIGIEKEEKVYMVDSMTYQEAWKLIHGTKMPIFEEQFIVKRIDQTGH